MKMVIPMYGIILEGDFNPSVILVDSATFMPHHPMKDVVKVCISAIRENGKIVGHLDTTEFECEDLGMAMIKISGYCLEKLAISARDTILTKLEIEALTSQ